MKTFILSFVFCTSIVTPAISNPQLALSEIVLNCLTETKHDLSFLAGGKFTDISEIENLKTNDEIVQHLTSVPEIEKGCWLDCIYRWGGVGNFSGTYSEVPPTPRINRFDRDRLNAEYTACLAKTNVCERGLCIFNIYAAPKNETSSP